LNEYLEIRNDILLESLVQKIDIYKNRVEDAGDDILSEDEHTIKVNPPRKRKDMSFIN